MQMGLFSFMGKSCPTGALHQGCIPLLLHLCCAAPQWKLIHAHCERGAGGEPGVMGAALPTSNASLKPHIPSSVASPPWSVCYPGPPIPPALGCIPLRTRTWHCDLQGAWHPLGDAWLFLLLEGASKREKLTHSHPELVHCPPAPSGPALHPVRGAGSAGARGGVTGSVARLLPGLA